MFIELQIDILVSLLKDHVTENPVVPYFQKLQIFVFKLHFTI